MVVIALVPSLGVARGDWYTEAGSHCSGYAPLVASVSTFFKKELSFISTSPPIGELAVSLRPADVRAFSAESPFIYERFDVSQDAAKSLRDVFKSSSDNRVPFFFKAANALLIGYTIPVTLLNAPVGFLFDDFYSRIDAQALAIENAAKFIAEGGVLEYQLFVKKAESGRFLLTQFVYSVPVGKEIRSFIISSCIYPVALQVTEFQTEGPYNNKVIKPIEANKWGVWDIEDNKWDSTDLRYLYQDMDNYFFESDEISDEIVVGRTIHKISTVGGGWQLKRSESPEFKGLYAKVAAH